MSVYVVNVAVSAALVLKYPVLPGLFYIPSVSATLVLKYPEQSISLYFINTLYPPLTAALQYQVFDLSIP